MNGVVIYDVVSAENKMLIRDTERRKRLQEARQVTGKKSSGIGPRFQQFMAVVRSTGNGQEQADLREKLAGC